LSETVTDLLEPVIVGVAPSTAPLLDAIVTLCGTGELFVKSIVTEPAFAVSELVSYFSAPLGSAASLSVPPPAGADADEDEALLEDEDEGDELLALLALMLEELLELPQPASATSADRRPAVQRRFIGSTP
jgi:hypothetical protein